jgi:hypothetical protein
MFLHNHCKKIVFSLNFICNAFVYVFLSIESHCSNALNDIDVVYKSILLSSLKFFLLISHK